MSRIQKFNYLFLTGLTVFMMFWWLLLVVTVPSHNTHAWLVWSTSFTVLLALGGYFGVMVWQKNEIGKLRTAIGVIAIGLVSQAIGGIVFGYLEYVHNTSGPFPSLADVFYVCSYITYFVGIILIAKEVINTKKYSMIFLCLIFAVLFSYSGWKMLASSNFSPGLNAQTAGVFGYIIFESAFSVIALALLFVTKFFKQQKHRAALSVLMFGLVLNYLVDFNFIYEALGKGWQFGAIEDIMYVPAYYVLTVSVILFLNVSVAIEILVVTVNMFLVYQVVFSTKSGDLISNMVVLMLCSTISVILMRHNKSAVKYREDEIRLQSLEQSNTKLLELDKQKTEFLNIAAHQLRTPVSVIRCYISMIQDGDFGEVPEQIKEVHSHIYQSNQWLVRLADEFLDLSKLESGQVKYRMEVRDLAKAVDEVVQEIRAKAIQKGLTLELIKPHEPIIVDFDSEKIKHATMNLVENAIKYTPQGNVVVKLAKEQDGVLVTVSDTGIGVLPEDIPNLFQKFRRGKNAHEIEVNTSTGLGLYIARRFVEGHGGRVWVKSEGEGKGGEFGYAIKC